MQPTIISPDAEDVDAVIEFIELELPKVEGAAGAIEDAREAAVNYLADGIGEDVDIVENGASVARGAAGTVADSFINVTAETIRAINREIGGSVELTNKAETVIANMSYREGALSQAATAIRDIAGGHLFDDGNKRTAQAVAELILG